MASHAPPSGSDSKLPHSAPWHCCPHHAAPILDGCVSTNQIELGGLSPHPPGIVSIWSPMPQSPCQPKDVGFQGLNSLHGSSCPLTQPTPQPCSCLTHPSWASISQTLSKGVIQGRGEAGPNWASPLLQEATRSGAGQGVSGTLRAFWGKTGLFT